MTPAVSLSTCVAPGNFGGKRPKFKPESREKNDGGSKGIGNNYRPFGGL